MYCLKSFPGYSLLPNLETSLNGTIYFKSQVNGFIMMVNHLNMISDILFSRQVVLIFGYFNALGGGMHSPV